MILPFVAMKCEDNPDLGANSGATYSWNNKIFYKTNITVTCPLGKAFQGIWKRSVTNQCNKQAPADTQVTWTYNDDRPLPNCVGKVLVLISFNRINSNQ